MTPIVLLTLMAVLSFFFDFVEVSKISLWIMIRLYSMHSPVVERASCSDSERCLFRPLPKSMYGPTS